MRAAIHAALPVQLLLAGGLLAQQLEMAADSAPELLTYDELVDLSRSDPTKEVMQKYEALLVTPMVSNAAARAGARPKRPYADGVGELVRVAFWNLERGYRLEQITMALRKPAEFLSLAAADSKRTAVAERQAASLSEADVILINEADLGVSRSDYKDVTAQLADALQMNYAFGVEFVEVDPLLLGLEPPRGDPESNRAWAAEHPVDRAAYRGLHGNAILSRYPILHARVLRLPSCYDWFGEEQRAVAQLEKGRRWTARRLFEERISREIRRGGRMAMLVDLAVPEADGGRVSVVVTHLENKCRPVCRKKQMTAVLDAIKETPYGLVLGGDLNTTGTDAAPTSIRREITRRAASARFWFDMAVRYLSPVTLPQIGFAPANHFKNYLDPTAFHLPLFLPNREDGLFRKVERFRFSDGGRFDFGGSPARTEPNRTGTLGNSNERHVKGFKPTFAFARTFGGLVGRYKLDWFFVRPAPDGALAPRNPATMNELNEVAGTRLSDHAPITVDLPLRAEGMMGRIPYLPDRNRADESLR